MSFEAWGKKAQKLRVPAGMVLGIVFLLLMHPSVRSLWIGGTLAWVGAWVRIWAAGHIEKGKELAQTGPYAFTRNPLYLGSLLMATGIFLAGQGYWLLPLFVVFYSVLYFPVMKAEEKEMLERFGQAFREYTSRVPLLFPRLWTGAAADSQAAPGSSASSTFEWSRVIRNGEHRTVAGLLLVEAFLIWRMS